MPESNSTYRHGRPPVLGVLLSNLGTPDEPTTSAVRRYLAEFLWDRRIVDVPRPIWWLVLHGVILRLRPARSARLYRKVWTESGSPLLAIARRQSAALQAALEQALPGPVLVELGMRYGNPSIGDAMARLVDAGAERVLVLPLYPQYSSTTTASTADAVFRSATERHWLPELRWINGYHLDAGYIEGLADSLREAWRERPAAEKLLFSFHGIPRRYHLRGDPYPCFCRATARAVAERLELPEHRWMVVFQSRFGREEWLKPYADETLQQLAGAEVGSVDVICPGFSADCLETLEEMEQENREVYLAAGGRSYRYIAALNDRPQHIRALADLVVQNVNGWPEANGNYPTEDTRQQSRERALALGAAD
jgi:ferrochelatase